uniref:CDT1 Geminin-binding domain-containing protein n=1 Tax=Meloidogyne incognita TaxID=6306 RepID=A0A914LBF6_MELIC
MKTNLCNDYFPRRLRPNFSLSGVPIPKELKRDHGFAHLPNKFNILMTLFNETEKILQAAHGRDQRKTFDELSANVEKNTKKKFTEKHLAQIVSLYPTAYTLRWERARDRRAIQLGLWELVIQPNLIGNKDLSPFVDSFLASISSLPNTPLLNSPNKFGEEDDKLSNNKWAMPNSVSSSPNKRPPSLTPVKLISPLKSPARKDCNIFSPKKPRNAVIFSSPIPDTRVKMDANRLKWRKLIFRHSLVGKVREAHSKFLEEKKFEFDDNQNLHPEFKKSINELVGDILTDGAIPSRPKSCGANLQTTDIRMFLKSVKKETKIEREKTPERPNQEQKIEGPPTLFKKLAVSSEPQTPKQCDDSKSLPPMTPIQERLRAKFTANEKAQKGGLSIMEKRRALLNRLDKSILEVIRAHLNLEQRFSVGLSEKSLLQKLGKEITSASLLEHLQLVCDLIPQKEPKICWLETLISTENDQNKESNYFKISQELGPEWVNLAFDVVKKELGLLEMKMRALRRSPSSCF